MTRGTVKDVPLFLLIFRAWSVFSLRHKENKLKYKPEWIRTTCENQQNKHVNSPADIFGVVFYVVREISNLIPGDALQPINDQLLHVWNRPSVNYLINQKSKNNEHVWYMWPDCDVWQHPSERAAPRLSSHSCLEPKKKKSSILRLSLNNQNFILHKHGCSFKSLK